MGGIGGKMFLDLKGILEPLHKMAEGFGNLTDFIMGIRLRHGAIPVVFVHLRHFSAEFRQRPKALPATKYVSRMPTTSTNRNASKIS